MNSSNVLVSNNLHLVNSRINVLVLYILLSSQGKFLVNYNTNLVRYSICLMSFILYSGELQCVWWAILYKIFHWAMFGHQKFSFTTTTPKEFPYKWGVGRSQCTRSYPYVYKTHREIDSNRSTENIFGKKTNDFEKRLPGNMQLKRSRTLSLQKMVMLLIWPRIGYT